MTKTPRKQTTTHQFRVWFERWNEEGADDEYAKENFPKVRFTMEARRRQLQFELEADRSIKGRFKLEAPVAMCGQSSVISPHTKFSDAALAYAVDGVFNLPGFNGDRDAARAELCRRIQRCYTDHGVDGFFKILD